ncbi:TadE family type IV pilus minor pilin [Plantactinospora sp. GCM10030261]|uniref:TadE family type IV pilus minor pilin n=1 Tax=Plantactinospora sp. GCM10030261 TaxID=3273420 RepID=UPI00360E491C
MTRRRQAGPGDRGSFTAELAAGLPALVLLMLTGLTAVNAVTVRTECLDTARDMALAVARGDERGRDAGETAPPGATLSVSVEGELVRVTVEAPVRALGTPLPGTRVTATAIAAVEPGTVAGPETAVEPGTAAGPEAEASR